VLAIFLFLLIGAAVLLAAFFLIRRERRFRNLLERQHKQLDERLKTTLERLEEERARLKTTFGGMTEGVLLTDARGDILHLNPAFQEMFSLEGKIEGRSALEILASVPSDNAIREVIRSGKSVEREILFDRPKRRVFQVHFSPMHHDGKLFGVVSVFHDLTEIRRLEEVRRDFVANLSHELKTPLTAIRGFSETLLEDSTPEETRKYLEVIFRHATDLSQLMENLLNLSQIESGKEEIRSEQISLKTFVDRLLERFKVQAELKKIHLSNETHESDALHADPPKLNQILSNLLDNAIKYTPPGGKIWIRARSLDRAFQMEVTDTGPGIPPEERSRVFERFYRIDKARSRETGGAGLGLAIVKHLVELHGGRITVESGSGQGSRFLISLPRS